MISLTLKTILIFIVMIFLSGCISENNKSFSETNLREDGGLSSEPEPVIQTTPVPEVVPETQTVIHPDPIPLSVVPESEPVIQTTPVPEVVPETQTVIHPDPIPLSVVPESETVISTTPIPEVVPETQTGIHPDPIPLSVVPEPETVIPTTPIPEVVPETQTVIHPDPIPLSVVPEAEIAVNQEFLCQKGDAIQEGQIKDIYNGRGIKNVLITINGCTTKTNSNGYYSLSNIAESERATLTMKVEKAYLQSTIVAIKKYTEEDTISTNYIEYKMSKYTSRWSYYSQKGMYSAKVDIPSKTLYLDDEGQKFDGLIYAGWIFQDTMNPRGRDAFPGTYEGKNANGTIVPFVSYGFVSLELKKKNGDLLQTSGDITLKFNQITGTKQDIISLWYYNYEQGIWIEEGYAQRQKDGTYLAQVSHTGTWSLSQAIEEEAGIFRSRIVDENGNPLSYIRVKAVGENWISRDLTTDENGNFEIKVIPNSNFRFKAYNYKDKYAAEYHHEMPGIASGSIVEY